MQSEFPRCHTTAPRNLLVFFSVASPKAPRGEYTFGRCGSRFRRQRRRKHTPAQTSLKLDAANFRRSVSFVATTSATVRRCILGNCWSTFCRCSAMTSTSRRRLFDDREPTWSRFYKNVLFSSTLTLQTLGHWPRQDFPLQFKYFQVMRGAYP
jgi:hypothetical protein